MSTFHCTTGSCPNGECYSKQSDVQASAEHNDLNVCMGSKSGGVSPWGYVSIIPYEGF